MKQTIFIILVSTMFIQGCSDDSPTRVICDCMAYPGIRVEVQDVTTRSSIAEGALAWVQDGSYIDTLELCQTDTLGNWLTFCGAYERPGIYTLVIEKDGYKNHCQENILVLDSVCHVNPVDLEVLLIRDVDIFIDVQPDTVQFGDNIDIHVFVTNNSAEDFILHFNTSCQFSYSIYNSNGELLYYFPTVCNMVLTTFQLAPAETHEEIKTVRIGNSNMIPGEYTISSVLLFGYSAETTFVVE